MKIVVLEKNKYRQLLDAIVDGESAVANQATLPFYIKGVELNGVRYFWGVGFKEGDTSREFADDKEVTPFIRLIEGTKDSYVVDFE